MSRYKLVLTRQVEESSFMFSKRANQIIASLAVEGAAIHEIKIIAESAPGIEIKECHDYDLQ